MVRTQDSHSWNRGSIPRSAANISENESQIPMFKLTKHTSKQELFAFLEANLKLPTKEVPVFVNSLPPFMGTRIALSIFFYQISSYPKKLIWQTTDEAISDFLSTSGFTIEKLEQNAQINMAGNNVDSQPTKSSSGPKDQTEFKKTHLDIVRVSKPDQSVATQSGHQSVEKTTEADVKAEPGEWSVSILQPELDSENSTNSVDSSTKPVRMTGETNSSLVLVTSNSRSLLEFKQKVQVASRLAPSNTNPTPENPKPIEPEFKNVSKTNTNPEQTTESISVDNSNTSPNSGESKNHSRDFNAWQDWLASQRTVPKLNLDNLTKQTQYKSNKLLQEGNPFPNLDQDLDQWLAKIKHTKQAIDGAKLANPSTTKINTQIVSFQPKVRSVRSFKRLYLLVSSVLSMLLLMLLLITLPTNVYTIKIDNPLIESSTTISLPVSKFTKKTVSATVSSTIESTGTKEVETTNATGKAILVNASGNNISLTNGGFYLIKDGKKYKHEFDSSLPKVISIPPRNDLNGPRIEVNVRAVNTGSQANLPENTKFNIVNLKEQTLGNALFAISITPIQNKELSGDRVVTQSDLDLLASLNQGKLAQEVGKELAKLRSENLFTDPDWYTIQITNTQADASAGQVQPKVNLTTEAVITLYYLPKDYLTQLIQATNSEINQVTDIVIKKYSGEVSRLENQISLDVFFSYTKKTQLDKNLIGQTLASEKDTARAEELLRKQFPNIKKIEKREFGLNIPIITPKIELEIVESG